MGGFIFTLHIFYLIMRLCTYQRNIVFVLNNRVISIA